LLAAGGRDRHISLWNMQTELCERMLAGTGATVNALAISRAHLVLAGMDDGDIAIWDLGGDAMEVQRRHEGPVNTVAFHPSGRMYASAGSDAAIRICDLATSPAEQDLIGHEGAVRSVAFSPDGSLLASAGDDGVVRLWDPRTGKNVYTLEEHGMPVRCVAFSLDSGRLAAAGNDRIVRVWDLTASISQ